MTNDDVITRARKLAEIIEMFVDEYIDYVFSLEPEGASAILTPVELKTILSYSASKLAVDTILETIKGHGDEKSAATMTTLVLLRAAQYQLEATEQPSAVLGEVQ